MEVLLSSSTATATAVSLNLSSSHSRPSILSTSLQFTKKNSFPKFISSPRHSILHQSSTQRTLYAVTAAAAVTASSSSSVAVDREIKDKLPADIQVTEFKEPNSTLRLNVNVPPIVCEDCYQRVLLEFTKQAKVPGFRPGKKVPESILINYIGKKHVKSALIESILKRTLPHAMSSVEGRALKDSVRITTKFSDMDESFSSPKDYLRYDVLVDVEPEIIWTPENGYKDLKITVEIDSGIAAEIACETEIKRRHKALGALRIVTDRGLQVHDVAILDVYTTNIKEDESDAEKIPSTESKDISEPNELDDAKVSVGLRKFRTEVPVFKRRELLPAFKSSFPDNLVEQESCIDKDIPYVPSKELKKREKRQLQKKQTMGKPSGGKSNEPLVVKKSSFTRKRSHERVAEGSSKKSVDETRTGRVRSEVHRETSADADAEQLSVVGASPRASLSTAIAGGHESGLGLSAGSPVMALPLSKSKVVAEPTFMRFPYERRNTVQARNLDLARNVTDATRFIASVTDGEGRPIHIDAEALQDPLVGGGLLNKMVLPKDFDKLNQFGPGELAQDLQGDIYRSNARATVLIGQIYDLEQKYERLRKSTSRAEVDKMVAEITALNNQVKHLVESERTLKKDAAISTLQRKKVEGELKRKDTEMANKMVVIDALRADKAKYMDEAKLKDDVHQTVLKDLEAAKAKCEEFEKENAILRAEKANVTDLFREQRGETLWLEKILNYHSEKCAALSSDITTLEAMPDTPEEPLEENGAANADVVAGPGETPADALGETPSDVVTITSAEGASNVEETAVAL